MTDAVIDSRGRAMSQLAASDVVKGLCEKGYRDVTLVAHPDEAGIYAVVCRGPTGVVTAYGLVNAAEEPAQLGGRTEYQMHAILVANEDMLEDFRRRAVGFVAADKKYPRTPEWCAAVIAEAARQYHLWDKEIDANVN